MGRSATKEVPLTKNEQRLLWFVAQSIDRDGIQPSMREIADELGFKSPGYIPRMVAACKRKGVVRGTRGARAIVFNWRAYL